MTAGDFLYGNWKARSYLQGSATNSGRVPPPSIFTAPLSLSSRMYASMGSFWKDMTTCRGLLHTPLGAYFGPLVGLFRPAAVLHELAGRPVDLEVGVHRGVRLDAKPS